MQVSVTDREKGRGMAEAFGCAEVRESETGFASGVWCGRATPRASNSGSGARGLATGQAATALNRRARACNPADRNDKAG